MRCVFGEGQNVCQRCANSDKTCVVEEKKQKQEPTKRELLMRELAEKDKIVDSLLRQIPDSAMRSPINLLPNISIPQQSSNAPERAADRDVLAWIESTRLNCPPTTGSIDTAAVHHPRVRTESSSAPPPTTPDKGVVNFGGSAPNTNAREQKNNDETDGPPRTPIELGPASAELDDTLHSIPPPTAPVGPIAAGLSESIGEGDITQYQHTPSQSGLLVPPRPNKRGPTAMEDGSGSESEEDGGGYTYKRAGGIQQGAVRRIKREFLMRQLADKNQIIDGLLALIPKADLGVALPALTGSNIE
ncbi:hypothetical protein FRC12_019987 [Ceratobasidium sp. 428]|nr:hypothetical protein FRC12_019987 [Ceratobasidium sp. 428]